MLADLPKCRLREACFHALDGGTIRLDELTIRRDELAKSARASVIAAFDSRQSPKK